MSATTKKRGPDPYADIYGFLALGGLVLVALLNAWVGAWAATGKDDPRPGSPLSFVIGSVRGDYTWPGFLATFVTVVLFILEAAGGLLIAFAIVRHRRKEIKVDRAVPYLASVHDVAAMTTKGVRKIGRRLGIAEHMTPGVQIGKSVRENADLWGSWEDMHVDIWGPRTGKTATRAIPNIVAAPGPVVVTSNKRDVLDATRLTRERVGRVWVFDPQGQANHTATWYWNPLSYVGSSIVRAVKLASRFASINRADHVRSDGYFEPAAEELISNLLLAASIEGLPITAIYTWLTRPGDDTPERILRAGGHVLSADAVDNVINAPDRQRAGVYGVAAQIMSFLIAPNMTAWVTADDDPDRPAFDYLKFVEDGADTIYLLSEETNKMAAPLITALTAALAEAAENAGIASPGGRLRVPVLFVLDEAANVCPWKALPDKYSHFGSRGVVMMTILQSWAQGVAAWGDIGMQKLWGAANVRVYGGGVVDTKFLGDLSAASGIFEPDVTSYSFKVTDYWEKNISKGSRSEPVLDVHDLASMPRGRAFVQFSGTKPALVRPVPWWEGEYADEIRESLAIYDPGAVVEAPAPPIPVALEKAVSQ
ncbi:type IV secretory system conjugative DNA transfer family protein [Yinghuangia sp. YIM S09857]|uniref:type IV secretory system conjugative DNA transfer family protein n=1 Tax=Yinghuangia sp. YIM S09857 TaxID=3436929 RepID=UPI003F532956